ncbi:MAG: hypothetical protein RIT04_698 [Candidatus Parcubacteria bacterium]|jgi:hypothetical protein
MNASVLADRIRRTSGHVNSGSPKGVAFEIRQLSTREDREEFVNEFIGHIASFDVTTKDNTLIVITNCLLEIPDITTATIAVSHMSKTPCEFWTSCIEKLKQRQNR